MFLALTTKNTVKPRGALSDFAKHPVSARRIRPSFPGVARVARSSAPKGGPSAKSRGPGPSSRSRGPHHRKTLAKAIQGGPPPSRAPAVRKNATTQSYSKPRASSTPGPRAKQTLIGLAKEQRRPRLTCADGPPGPNDGRSRTRRMNMRFWFQQSLRAHPPPQSSSAVSARPAATPHHVGRPQGHFRDKAPKKIRAELPHFPSSCPQSMTRPFTISQLRSKERAGGGRCSSGPSPRSSSYLNLPRPPGDGHPSSPPWRGPMSWLLLTFAPCGPRFTSLEKTSSSMALTLGPSAFLVRKRPIVFLGKKTPVPAAWEDPRANPFHRHHQTSAKRSASTIVPP